MSTFNQINSTLIQNEIVRQTDVNLQNGNVRINNQPAVVSEKTLGKIERQNLSSAQSNSDFQVEVNTEPAFKRFSSGMALTLLRRLKSYEKLPDEAKEKITVGHPMWEKFKNGLIEFFGSKEMKAKRKAYLNNQLQEIKSVIRKEVNLRGIPEDIVKNVRVPQETKADICYLFSEDTDLQKHLDWRGKLSLLKTDAQEVRNGGSLRIDRSVFTDGEFLSDLLVKNSKKARELIKDFFSLNAAEIQKELRKQWLQTENTVNENGFQTLSEYFLNISEEGNVDKINTQLWTDMRRGFNLSICIDGEKFSFEGKDYKLEKDFLKDVKEKIKDKSGDIKKKVADFIVNTPSQGLLFLPVPGTDVFLLYDQKDSVSLDLNIDGKNNRVTVDVSGNFKTTMRRHAIGLLGKIPVGTFNANEFDTFVDTTGNSLTQKLDFRFQFGWDKLLSENGGKVSHAEVKQFDQTIE